jgi:K(+)-stimulated pyrophosphate-energized sodium pump
MAIILGVLIHRFMKGFPQGLPFGIEHGYCIHFRLSMCTTVAAYVGMMAAVEANVRTANAAKQGAEKGVPSGFLRRRCHGPIYRRFGPFRDKSTLLSL